MSDLSQGSSASLILAPGESYRISTSGTATVRPAYGAPAVTTTLNAQSQDFGPYAANAKLEVVAVVGTARYSLRQDGPVNFSPDQQAVIDQGGGVVVADLAGSLTGPGGAIAGVGGGGGVTTFAGLTDKASVDLPTINIPLKNALTAKAPLASPTFTGTPAAPTAAPGTNTTQIATCEFVLANAGSGGGGGSLGKFANVSALQAAKPAASNEGFTALVGAAAPYTPYISNGTAWTVFDSGSDPLVTIAASGSAVSQAASNLSVIDITLTANTTVGFSGVPAGAWTVTLILKQDATGARLVTWPANTRWASGPAPTLSTAAAAIDVVTLMTTNGGTTWYGFLNGRGMV